MKRGDIVRLRRDLRTTKNSAWCEGSFAIVLWADEQCAHIRMGCSSDEFCLRLDDVIVERYPSTIMCWQRLALAWADFKSAVKGLIR